MFECVFKGPQRGLAETVAMVISAAIPIRCIEVCGIRHCNH